MKESNNKSKDIKRSLLLISYHFPPSTAVGGIRIANFARNLPLLGWNIYVLTLKERYLNQRDTQRLKGINTVKICKTLQLPTILDIYLKLKTIWFSFLWKRRVSLAELESSYVPPALNPNGSENLFQKLRRYLISFLIRPDKERSWILPAVFRAVWEIKREKIDCILTSGPPYSVHLIGILVKLITGVRWIADFRDPWIITVPESLYVSCALTNKIEGWLEKNVILRADVVLTNTERYCRILKKIFNDQPQSKFLYIPNGFNMDEISKLSHLKKYEKFTLTYTGTLYLDRSPEPVFQAIKELEEEKKLSLGEIQVKIAGNSNAVRGRPISQLISNYGLNSVVEILNEVSYAKALEIIKRSHVALLFAPNQPYQIPAKAYDYLGMGTTILALTGEGATRDLMESTNCGLALSPSDIEGIKKFIYDSMTNGKKPRLENSLSYINCFNMRLITQKLADQIKIII